MNYDSIFEYIIGCLPVFNIDIIVRLFTSLFLGLIIGFEREVTHKTAGMRTHILVCLGSTVFTILSIYGFSCANPDDTIRLVHDPSRIAAQVLTGIGFIGGGAVLHHGLTVYGLTTAATLWVTASIGMAVGAGSYGVAVLATVFTFLVLVIIRKFESRFLARRAGRGGRIRISTICAKDNRKEIQDWFYKEFKSVQEMDVDKLHDEVKLTFVVDIAEPDPINSAYKKLSSLENIESLNVKQL